MARGRIAAADRPTFDDIREEIGEDPARFLCGGLEIAPRVKGIQSEEVLDAWEQVERELFDPPRSDVLNQLDARRQRLQSGEEDHQSAAGAEGAQTLVSEVEAMDDPADVQEVLDAEVARDDARTEVVGACNVRLDELEEDEPEPAREIPEVVYDSREDPEYQQQYREALSIAGAFGLTQLGERLREERERDAPRPHVIDALETRQEALRAELPDGDAEEVAA